MVCFYRLNSLIYILFLFFISTYVFAAVSSLSSNTLKKDMPEKTITLNFQAIKVRSALQLLAEFSGVNLIIDDKVQGSVSLYLSDMTWQQALDTILQTQDLVKYPLYKGWFITSSTEMLKRDKIKFEMQQQAQELAPLIAKIIQVRYSKAMDISQLLKANTDLSSRGSVSVDNRTNSLWIRDSSDRLNKIEKSIRQLDRPIDQIAIEARIVSIDQNRERELGARFGLSQSSAPTLESPAIKKITPQPAGLLHYLNMDLPMAGVSGMAAGAAIGLHLMRLGKNAFLDLELSALESEGGAQIISTPHLITADQQAAFIEAGEEIPYQEKTASGATNIVFKKAVLGLNVTPRIMPDRRILLDLVVNQDQPSTLTVLDSPTIKARGIKTQVIVKDGETVVLGGIYEYTKNQIVQQIPFLSAIPLIGYLFRYKSMSDRRNELLIFLTPSILK